MRRVGAKPTLCRNYENKKEYKHFDIKFYKECHDVTGSQQQSLFPTEKPIQQLIKCCKTL